MFRTGFHELYCWYRNFYSTNLHLYVWPLSLIYFLSITPLVFHLKILFLMRENMMFFFTFLYLSLPRFILEGTFVDATQSYGFIIHYVIYLYCVTFYIFSVWHSDKKGDLISLKKFSSLDSSLANNIRVVRSKNWVPLCTWMAMERHQRRHE